MTNINGTYLMVAALVFADDDIAGSRYLGSYSAERQGIAINLEITFLQGIDATTLPDSAR